MVQHKKRLLVGLFGVLVLLAVSSVSFLPADSQYAQVIVFSTVGSGTTSPSGVQNYGLGSQVEIRATPQAGYSFSSWSANPSSSVVFTSSTSALTNATIHGSATITATFIANTYVITLNTGTGGSVTRNPDQPTYSYNALVLLTAVASSGYSFVGWGGALTGTSNPASVTLDNNKTVSATFQPNLYMLTISPGSGGTVSKNPDQASYSFGASVQLTANPAAGYTFSGWSGAASGSANPLTIVMDANKTVSANFILRTYTLDVSAGVGGSVTKVPNQATYTHGAIVQVTATPSLGYNFAGWSGSVSGTNNPLNVTMDANKVITANFVPRTYVLTVNADPLGGNVVKNPNQSTYNHSSTVQLTANPNVGYNFVSWSGSVSGTSNPLTLTMDGDKTVTANFALKSYNLNVNVGQGGSVSRNPDRSTYTHGSLVQLTASSNPGYTFAGWTGSVSGSNNPATLTMDADKSVTATFIANSYQITLTPSAGGSIVKSPNQASYAHGTVVQLSAVASTGYTFVGWGGALTGTSNPASITIDADKTVSATFVANSYRLDVTSSSGGSVAKTPNSQSYNYGTVVQLRATPAAGYFFVGWSGAVSGSSNPISVTVDSNKAVFAEFTQTRHQVTFAASGSGTVYPAGTQTIPEDGVIAISAVPNAGNAFTSWTVNPSGSVVFENSNSASTSATIKGSATVTANFREVPPEATPTPTSKPTPTLKPSSSPVPSPSPSHSISPSPSVTLTPEPISMISKTIPAELNDGSIVYLNVFGNLKGSTISNVYISSDQAAEETTFAMTFLIADDQYSFCNVTIPKSQVTYGTVPTVYINSQVASDFGYSEDTNNYNVWYNTPTNAYELSITFANSSTNTQMLIAIPICLVSVFLVMVIMMPSLKNKK